MPIDCDYCPLPGGSLLAELKLCASVLTASMRVELMESFQSTQLSANIKSLIPAESKSRFPGI